MSGKNKNTSGKEGKVEKSDENRDEKMRSIVLEISEECYRQLDIKFDELQLKLKKEKGKPIQKTKDYYPAVLQVGMKSGELEAKVEQLADRRTNGNSEKQKGFFSS